MRSKKETQTDADRMRERQGQEQSGKQVDNDKLNIHKIQAQAH